MIPTIDTKQSYFCIAENPHIKASYFCGEKLYDKSISCNDNKRFRLTISNARQIDFAGYQPRAKGELADRPWVFANYLLDRMPL